MTNQLTATDVRALSLELSATVLQQVAPEELLILNEIAEEFWATRDEVLNPRRRDEALGFGLDLALMTPYVLAVCGPVVGFLGDCVLESVRSETQARTDTLIGRLFRRVPGRRHDGEPNTAIGNRLTEDQVRQVRDLARTQAARSGLRADRAELLADAVVGALVVSSAQ